MEQYIIIRAKSFRKIEEFDQRVNEAAQKGYRALSISGESGTAVLMERIQ
jgi:hypothetical protein